MYSKYVPKNLSAIINVLLLGNIINNNIKFRINGCQIISYLTGQTFKDAANILTNI